MLTTLLADEANMETKTARMISLIFEKRKQKSILSTHPVPGGGSGGAPVLNDPMRDGLRRIIGRNFVSNIRL